VKNPNRNASFRVFQAEKASLLSCEGLPELSAKNIFTEKNSNTKMGDAVQICAASFDTALEIN